MNGLRRACSYDAESKPCFDPTRQSQINLGYSDRRKRRFLTSRGESIHFRLSKPVWPWVVSVDEHVYFTIPTIAEGLARGCRVCAVRRRALYDECSAVRARLEKTRSK
jgi:hypothetical protein